MSAVGRSTLHRRVAALVRSAYGRGVEGAPVPDEAEIERTLALLANRDDLYEQLAAVQHDIWSHWMRYLLNTKAEDHGEAGLWLSEDDVARWREQAATAYAELTDREKASDREQVDRFWSILTGDGEVGLGAPGVLWMALRYALGRRTYAVSEACTAIEENLPNLTHWQAARMASEIEQHLELTAEAAVSQPGVSSHYSDDLDNRWRQTAAALRERAAAQGAS